MEKIKNIKWSSLPVYPFLFGIYPVLYLWSANRVQQPAYVVIPSLLISLAAELVIFAVLFAIVRNPHRAALMTLIVSFFILTYGHIMNQVKAWKWTVDQHTLLPLTALLVLALLVIVALRRWGGPQLTKALNLVSIALVIAPLITAAPYYLSVARLQADPSSRRPQQKLIPPTGTQPQRDVYFILLDNYGRQDVLKTGSHFDNSELVNQLKARGFIFPDCAQGNYSSTAPVIASILNMNYLDKYEIKETSYTKRGGYDQLAPLILKSSVIDKFHEYGYHVVTFAGFMGLIDIHNSDTYISYDKDKAYNQRLETANFQSLYLQTTIFQSINDVYKIYPDLIAQKAPPEIAKMLIPTKIKSPLEPRFEEVYKQKLYSFDALERIPKEIRGPKFVYAHIYTAHWPFMMRPDGSLRLPFTQELTEAGYVDGVRYTNSRILNSIDSILKNSKVPPVIILQGDHSDEWTKPVEWSGIDRMKILSAYYLPDGGGQLLYDTISPVNNFRLVFNKYFGEKNPLLPDINHYLDPKTRTIKEAPKSCISDSK